jgi:hypothetical protein
VPISFLIQQCASAGLCDGDYDRVKDWITILEKAGMLLLRGVAHPALQGQTMTVVSPDGSRCRAFLGPELAEAIAGEAAVLEMVEGEPLIAAEEMAEGMVTPAGGIALAATAPESQAEAAPPSAGASGPAAPSSASALDSGTESQS